MIAPARRQTWLEVSRGRAFATHLGVSASIVGAVCTLIFLIWYPQPYFQAAGAWNVLRVLLGVDLVLGPLLTLIVFKPGKWGLKFDLTVIAVIQLSALIYGTTVIYRERPYFTVFAVDRFHVLALKDVDQSQLAAAGLGSKPFVGPLLAIARRPEDTAGWQRLLEETLFEGKPDIEQRPEFWSTYTDHTDEVINKARPLGVLKSTSPEAAEDVERLLQRLERLETELAYLPLITKNQSLSMIVDLADGTPLEALDLNPWVSGNDEAQN